MTLQERTNAISDGIHKSVETNGFYQTPNSMAIKAIRGKLTAADWALWSSPFNANKRTIFPSSYNKTDNIV